MVLLLSRTIYFLIEKTQVYLGDSDEKVMHFGEQLYVYISENTFSALIVTFLII